MPFDRSHHRRPKLLAHPGQTPHKWEHQPDAATVIIPNRVVLAGTIITDPELHDTTKGAPVCHLRIVTYTRANNWASGVQHTRCNHFNVAIWGVKGENALLQLINGDLIAVAGRLESGERETSDGIHEVVEIVADRLAFKRDGQFEEIGDELT